jgi:hypothetical protein
MKNILLNIKYVGIWGINEVHSLKYLRLDTPVSLPTVVITLIAWFAFLTYALVL